MRKPVALDLYSGLGGWAEGLEDVGYDVIRVDIEDMFTATGTPKPDPCLLILQDIRTIHGSQFKHVDLIVASPPCQEYSYMAMPWTRAKAIAGALRGHGEFPEGYTGSRTLEALNALLEACFRIQREASEAAGRQIPMVVENVKGAQPWIGRSRYAYGSYHLWGDVPALMPYTQGRSTKRTGRTMCYPLGSANPDAVKGRTGKLHWQDDSLKVPGFRFDGSGRSFQTASVEGQKAVTGGWFNDGADPNRMAAFSSKSSARKVASARIAKIPSALSRYIGEVYKPR